MSVSRAGRATASSRRAGSSSTETVWRPRPTSSPDGGWTPSSRWTAGGCCVRGSRSSTSRFYSARTSPSSSRYHSTEQRGLQMSVLQNGNLKSFNLDGLVDTDTGVISREIFVNEKIFEMELENLFSRAWLFVGHESQIPNPGDYFMSRMGTDTVLMTRDNDGEVHVLLNSCRHRGMRVCRYDSGNTMTFTCPFHGWAYSVDGRLVSRAGELFGVPKLKAAYNGKLEREKWGLVEATS